MKSVAATQHPPTPRRKKARLVAGLFRVESEGGEVDDAADRTGPAGLARPFFPTPGGRGDVPPPQWLRFLTTSSTIFLASANSIIVLSRKNSSFSTPA